MMKKKFRFSVPTVWVPVVAVLLACEGCTGLGAKTRQSYLAEAKRIVTELPPQQAHEELRNNPNAFVLCVCPKDEYDQLHLENSVLIPRGLLEFQVAKNELYPRINSGRTPRKDQRIIVYCRSGSRGLLAAKTLKEMGYTNVVSIKGGIDGWVKAGLPVVKGPPEK